MSELHTYALGVINAKILVLLHDFCNIRGDHAAEARTLATTDELCISGPYFTPEEAIFIENTIVFTPRLTGIPEFETLEPDDGVDQTESDAREERPTTPETMTIEGAIKSRLQSFFEKRRNSGDARPCGPHDLAPIHNAVVGITKEQLKNEKFLGRLRRTVLGISKAGSSASGGKQKEKGERKG